MFAKQVVLLYSFIHHLYPDSVLTESKIIQSLILYAFAKKGFSPFAYRYQIDFLLDSVLRTESDGLLFRYILG